MTSNDIDITVNDCGSDFDRDLYWIKIKIHIDKKNTLVFAGISQEYLEDEYGNDKKRWENYVKRKWHNAYDQIGDELFENDMHYDCYAETTEGENNCIDFLIGIKDE